MEEIIISPTIDALIETLKSAAEEEIKFVWGVDEELNCLLKSFSVIQSVLADAEGKQRKSNSVKKWLLRLKNMAYDAEDVVEEFITGALETKMGDRGYSTPREDETKQDKGADQSRRRKQVMNLRHFFHSKKPVHLHEIIRDKLRSLRKTVVKIEKECRRLRLTEAQEQVHMQANIDEQLQNVSRVESLVFGREEDKTKLVAELLSDQFSGGGPSVIPIVAPDGIGKTTFARLVYTCKEVEQHFKHRWWFCASPDLDEERIAEEILMSATWYYDGGITDQLRLKDWLRNNKFLVVLDNVRDDDPSWKELLKPFTSRHKQSKIIITTRSDEIGSILGTAPPYRLKGLSYEDCTRLFAAKAVDAESFERHPNLREIGEKIVGKVVEKCGGFPLAVKALGGLLCNKRNQNEWLNVLESPTWDITAEDNNGVLPALKICYQQLPANSKMCFRYSSLLPRDYLFLKNELVELWIGEGYIQDHECREEDEAKQIFYDFLIKSFFAVESFYKQKTRFEVGTSEKERFKMHDMAHELAEAVSNEEIVKMEEGKPVGIPQAAARHSSVVYSNKMPLLSFEELCKCHHKSLRSFLHVDWLHYKRLPEENVGGRTFLNEQLHLLLQCKFLRVLRLQGSMIETLPESITSLKLLHFLDLSHTPLMKLPDSICRLYNLQTLDLRSCICMTEWPQDMKKFINLRFLYFDSTSLVYRAIAHVGSLRKLQTLPRFCVGKETGYKISELKEMSNLKGKFNIDDLQNVASGEEAKEANMKGKPYITDLRLDWSRIYNGNRDDEVLEALEPHSNLKKLCIHGYHGRSLPSWLQHLTSLQSLDLLHCREVASLPENGLPRGLQTFSIASCPLLKQRCKEETGEDWPKIAHIPQVTVFGIDF